MKLTIGLHFGQVSHVQWEIENKYLGNVESSASV